MKAYVFRNYTVEHLFDENDFEIGAYGNLNVPQSEYQYYLLFFQINPSSTPDKQVAEIQTIKERISLITDQIPSSIRVVVMSLSTHWIFAWECCCNELLNEINSFNNQYLKGLEIEKSAVQIIDLNSFHCLTNLTDWKYLFLSQMIIDPKLSEKFKNWYSMQIRSLFGARKKCMILDCDNTLWGGIVGEDDHQIHLGEGYPGECFQRFQQLIVEASEKGIILAVCSKNNLQDVQHVWNSHPANILNEKHLSAFRINWMDKASNIKSIAEELNIGLDSCVFIDDNETERELIKKYLPEVEVPDFPENSYNLIPFFWQVYQTYFLTYQLSDEDRNKTRSYKDNQKRKQLMQQAINIEDYLSSLDIKIAIYENTDEHIGRIAQLMNKTNQFNVTTKRYLENDLIHLRNTGFKILSARVKDKFGDNGITAVCILEVRDDTLSIESYLLSCRILGRNIENILLCYILKTYAEKDNLCIKAMYRPSEKNKQCATFFDDLGFTHTTKHGDDTKVYLAKYDQLKQHHHNYKIEFYGRPN
ncbi:HAD-IIIC family phosphatase [Chryseobacterium indologenes]|uniref:HAD-IIIC family phosphatase n=1 Tax=Chryseobacterium indologenes TaxID=253 RepID=UPI00143EA78F|nr:HAD-IIIC family phosphatase [Chryseobacterium indologenes]QIX80553.1 HAD-IIIC family phosphatase [Chryseobacterium indologenes]UDQ54211.1 HAD-IIIC family phosphatase [Chryseobacterium indologenes]